MENLEIFIGGADAVFTRRYDVYLRKRFGDIIYRGDILSLTQVKSEDMDRAFDPSFSLSAETLQSLCDQIHQLGFRPSRQVDMGKDVEEAQKEHIKDLNKIVDAHVKMFTHIYDK